jgi:hypothetical protein
MLSLLFAVGLDVVLGCMLGVIGSVGVMPVREMGVVGGLFVIALGVRCRGCMVMARSVLVVLRCLGVIFRCFV